MILTSQRNQRDRLSTPFRIREDIFLLPFEPPKIKNLKNVIDTLGMLSLENRDALRKLITNNPLIYFKNPDIPKIYKGQKWLSSGFEIPIYELADLQEVCCNTYVNVLSACFSRKLLLWWANILDLKTFCKRHLNALRTYSIIYDAPNEPYHYFKSIGSQGKCLLMDIDKKLFWGTPKEYQRLCEYYWYFLRQKSTSMDTKHNKK